MLVKYIKAKHWIYVIPSVEADAVLLSYRSKMSFIGALLFKFSSVKSGYSGYFLMILHESQLLTLLNLN